MLKQKVSPEKQCMVLFIIGFRIFFACRSARSRSENNLSKGYFTIDSLVLDFLQLHIRLSWTGFALSIIASLNVSLLLIDPVDLFEDGS